MKQFSQVHTANMKQKALLCTQSFPNIYYILITRKNTNKRVELVSNSANTVKIGQNQRKQWNSSAAHLKNEMKGATARTIIV